MNFLRTRFYIHFEYALMSVDLQNIILKNNVIAYISCSILTYNRENDINTLDQKSLRQNTAKISIQ